MRRNCNLELRLVSPAMSFDPTDYNSQYHPMLDMFSGSTKEQQQLQQQQQQQQHQQQQQQLTIFYNGRMTVCDVTELQARAIILLASREMEERSKTPMGSSPTSPLLHSQLQSPTGLSMKRSLQQFLQKRKNRVQATSPYHH